MRDISLVGITDLVTGEKDPRNLMLVFSMLRVIILEWDISKHAETLFDSVYVYFPITFRPPPNDPYGITAQELKDRLRDCISSSELLAPYSIPNLLDRLDSTSLMTKKDILEAMLACAKSYGPHTMSKYSVTFWDALKFEVLSTEPELAEDTLRVLREIAVCLSKSTNTSATSSPLSQYLRPIIKECTEHFQEPAQGQAKAAGDMLKAVSSANDQSFTLIVKSILPALFTVYQSADGIIKQRSLLEVVNQLLESALAVYGSWKTPHDELGASKPDALLTFKDQFQEVYSRALMGTVKEEVSFRITAAKGLLLLSKLRTMLEDSEIGLIVQHFDEIFLQADLYGSDELRKAVMQSLAEIATHKPRLIMDITFPAFMACLPDTSREAHSQGKFLPTLEGLAEISLEKDVCDTLMRRLLNKFDVLLHDESSSYRYPAAILSTVFFVLNRRAKHYSDLEACYDRIVVGLTQKAFSALSMSSSNLMLQDVGILQLLGRIVTVVARKSPSRQHQTFKGVQTLFTEECDLGMLTSTNAGSGKSSALIMSTALLAAVPRSQVFDPNEIREALERLGSFVLEASVAEAARKAALQQILLYINKHLDNANLSFPTALMRFIYSSLANAARTRGLHILLIFNITKAMALRLALGTSAMLAELVTLLDPDTYSADGHTADSATKAGEDSHYAAARFASLLASDEVVSKVNGAQIRLLAPQQVFQTLTPLLAAKFRDSTDAIIKENCLTALSGVISSVSSELAMSELTTMLPLLLQSLDLTDQTVKLATLEMLGVVIAKSPAALQETGHVTALVKRLLSTSMLPSGHAKASRQSMKTDPMQRPPGQAIAAEESIPKVRQMAVRCLFLMPGNITGLPNPLLAVRSDVLKSLGKILDDPKRDVRKEAVDARAAWIRGVDDVHEDDSD